MKNVFIDPYLRVIEIIRELKSRESQKTDRSIFKLQNLKLKENKQNKIINSYVVNFFLVLFLNFLKCTCI